MPEILTESFCERCGTRYTFESSAPRKTRRLGQIKTLSKGMKNWVMSDDTSLDEAMAAARNDDDRELTSQQLDAFHATFNFCMTCRQYTCGNCWNAAEGHCLTCAPHLGHEVLPAPFPDQVAAFEPVRIDAESWPEVDLSVAAAADANGNGHANSNGFHDAELDPWAQTGAADVEDLPEIDPAARLAFLSGEVPLAPAESEPEVTTGLIGWPEPEEFVSFVAEGSATDTEAVETAATADAIETPIETAPAETLDAVAAAGEPAPIDAEASAPDALSPILDSWASTGAANTSELLRRFRPGQNIDAELAAFEAERDLVAEPLSETAAAFAEDAPEPVDVPQPAAAAAQEPVLMVEPEPVVAAAPEPEPLAMDATAVVEDVAAPSAPAVLSIGWKVPAAPPEPITPAPEPVAAEIVAPEPIAAEPEQVTTEPEPEPVAAEPEPVAAEPEPVVAEPVQPAPVAAEPEPEPEPVAAEPEPVAAEPAPVAAEPEPVAAEPVEPAPVAAESPREDRIPQPTWQIFAPDAAPTEGRPLVTPVAPVAPLQPPAAAGRDPQWPVRPDQAESPAMALLANRANRTSSDDLWAASSQQVLAHPPTLSNASPTSGVQPCSSCGLSLSATARFCRRCGTRQG